MMTWFRKKSCAFYRGAAQVVNVGKRCGAKGISQDEINQRMVSVARTGKIVARLKNG